MIENVYKYFFGTKTQMPLPWRHFMKVNILLKREATLPFPPFLHRPSLLSTSSKMIFRFSVSHLWMDRMVSILNLFPLWRNTSWLLSFTPIWLLWETPSYAVATIGTTFCSCISASKPWNLKQKSQRVLASFPTALLALRASHLSQWKPMKKIINSN